jgi:hypothetical protein
MAVATMTRWSEAMTFYSFFMCFGLVLYWMILNLYWTCGELDVLFWVSVIFWILSCFGGFPSGEAAKTAIIYKKIIQYIRRLTDAFIHMALIFIG